MKYLGYQVLKDLDYSVIKTSEQADWLRRHMDKYYRMNIQS